ncbi:extracellular solute-binding protein [Microbacterium sp. QXD-8]|uniref:Extracellular solute-binding protein n=1 Tax=Microbacterium psychrotolerans TaxID=3068321 RepID=A0ABU0YVZ3_9MICO|nr:extracellular solute-binding protein [Microbacterium sp. QXD-8]MDQ7876499.1 extracellular solute-binding protein [Microbacterium sp. QXD-8]
MMRMTRMLALAGVAVVSLGLAACSAGSQSEDGRVTLTYWKLADTNDASKQASQEIIDGFEKEHPEIKIDVQERATDAHKEALRTSLGTSAAPDVYWSWAGPGIGGEYVQGGASLDLKEYYDEYDWSERFSDVGMASVRQYGGYDGVPNGQAGAAVFYNKDLFAQAGISEPPTTYDELVQDAEKLVAAGITPIEFGGTVNWHLMRLLDNILMTQCGPETFRALITAEADWAEESCVDDTFEEFHTWTQDYLTPGWASLSDSEANALFFQGEAAMVIEGNWFDNVLRSNEVDTSNIGVFLFPTGTGELYGDTSNVYISATSEHPDEAALFLDYLTSEEPQQISQRLVGARPINVNVAVDESTQDSLDKQWNPLFDEATGLYYFNDQGMTLAMTTEYWRIQNLVATDELDPSKAGAELQKFIDNQ